MSTNYDSPITLASDCEAVLIPDGTAVTLNKGTEVYVTQALGSSVTVQVNGNLARISGEAIAALGIEIESAATKPVDSGDGTVDEDIVWAELSTCFDPEIPINIVELGLIYKCEITPIENGHCVDIDMTLTAPGCGMGPFLVEDVREKIEQIANVTEVNVELVFDPPWGPEMMSEAARLQTGMY